MIDIDLTHLLQVLCGALGLIVIGGLIFRLNKTGYKPKKMKTKITTMLDNLKLLVQKHTLLYIVAAIILGFILGTI